MARNRRLLFHRQGKRCYYCNELMTLDVMPSNRPDMCTVDRLLPGKAGGTYAERNVVAACLFCNSHRGTMNYEEFMVWANSPEMKKKRSVKRERLFKYLRRKSQ